MRAQPTHSLLLDEPEFTFVCPHGHATVRRLRLWRTVTGGTIAVVTEAPTDEGMSITNAAEVVYAAVQRKYGDPASADIPVIEHYPGERGEADTFDEVRLDRHGVVRWTRIAPALLLLSVGLDAYPNR